MPLLRYFLFVGGSLIALMLVVNVAFPTAPLPENLTSGSDLPPIRIHSERKLPERVVIDTSVALPMQAAAAPVAIAQVKPQAQIQVQTPAQADGPALQTNVRAPVQPAISAKARVREAFAQLPREERYGNRRAARAEDVSGPPTAQAQGRRKASQRASLDGCPAAAPRRVQQHLVSVAS
jgi:hypothetical protein